MRLKSYDRVGLDERVYVLTISGGELMRAKLHGFDRALVRDIQDDPDATISDQLLGLEMLARRIEESHELAG